MPTPEPLPTDRPAPGGVPALAGDVAVAGGVPGLASDAPGDPAAGCDCCGSDCCIRGLSTFCLDLRTDLATDSPYRIGPVTVRVQKDPDVTHLELYLVFGATYTDAGTGITVCAQWVVPVDIDCQAVTVFNPLKVPLKHDNVDCSIDLLPYGYVDALHLAAAPPLCDGSDDGGCFGFAWTDVLVLVHIPARSAGNHCGVGYWTAAERLGVALAGGCAGPAAGSIPIPGGWFATPFCGGTARPADFNLAVTMDFAADCAGDDLDYFVAGGSIEGQFYEAPFECPCAVCATRDNCPGWPYAGVAVAVGGLTNAADCLHCGDYSTGGLADCINRTWEPPLLSDENHSSGCVTTYKATCTGDFGGDASSVVTRVVVSTTADGQISVTLTIAGTITSPTLGVQCAADRTYRAQWAAADFPCGGPWVLADQGSTGDNCVDGWPGTVSVSPTGGGGEASFAACCDGTRPAPSFRCDGETQTCSDPGDGSGEHATYEACVEACVTTPLGDSGDDTGGGRGVEDLECCPGHTLPRSLSAAVVNIANFPCLEGVYGMVWANALRAWTGSFVACGTFISLYFYCLGGMYGFRLVCNGVTIVDQLHEPGLPCDPISESFGGAITVPSSCGGLPGEINVFVTGGS